MWLSRCLLLTVYIIRVRLLRSIFILRQFQSLHVNISISFFVLTAEQTEILLLDAVSKIIINIYFLVLLFQNTAKSFIFLMFSFRGSKIIPYCGVINSWFPFKEVCFFHPIVITHVMGVAI